MKKRNQDRIVALSIAWPMLIAGLAGPITAQVTQRSSVGPGGVQANFGSLRPSISADGRYVAFESGATNLIAGDPNGGGLFLRDRTTGTNERVSISSSGAPGNGVCQFPSVSSDGRYVAFDSPASNLVAGDTNGVLDVFVRDRQAGTTERVSISSGGVQGNNDSYLASISADGRYVAFLAIASNLVANDTNGFYDIFVRDRQNGTTERVSLSSGGAQGNHDSAYPSISGDGRYVAFQSVASNLVPSDVNQFVDVFVRDRQSSTTERVSVSPAGFDAWDASFRPSISATGRYVAFSSWAENLVAGDSNFTSDIFVRDRQTSTTDRASVATGGGQGNSLCGTLISISADGRYVAFESNASNLVGGDTNNIQDIFVRDRQSATTEMVSLSSGGTPGSSLSECPSITSDGRYVAFDSYASNLVPGDTNGVTDVFLRDRLASGFTSSCAPGVAGVIACPCSNPPSASGRGCNNFGAGPVDSGTLNATGVAYLATDSVVLHATGENDTSLTVFWTGSGALSGTGLVHGAGIRCVTANLKRLYTGSASGGAISRPAGGGPSVSARTAAVGAPISAGETRHYFTIYRDPSAAGPCGNTSSTINLTNAGSIAWNL